MNEPFKIQKLRIGTLENLPFFVDVEVKETGELSICGQHGLGRNANYGQLLMCFKEYDYRGNLTLDTLVTEAKNEEHYQNLVLFFDLWNRWHLNHMNAGSPAQEAYLREHPATSYETVNYSARCKELESVGLNPDPNYLVNGKPYQYGHAWIKEELPTEVYDTLKRLLDYFKTLKF